MNPTSIKFRLNPTTLKYISEKTTLSEHQLKTLPTDETVKIMKERGVIKDSNPVFTFFKEQYIKLGKTLGFIDKRVNL